LGNTGSMSHEMIVVSITRYFQSNSQQWNKKSFYAHEQPRSKPWNSSESISNILGVNISHEIDTKIYYG
jgi:hypothetical protein